MTRTFPSLGILILLFTFPPFAFGDPAAAQALDIKRIEAAARSAADERIAAGTPGMTVTVARNGEIVFARAYGKADVELNVPASVESVYRIGSVTKQFTAAIIMRLAEAGKISLDDPLTKYLPDYPTQGHNVTIRHLLNHTSGIKSIRVRQVDEAMRQRLRLDLSDQEVRELFANAPFDFAPGAKYQYNNSGYLLLGMIIAEVTGTPYDTYVERELLQPLALTQTKYCDDSRIIPNRAEGYETIDGQLGNAPYLNMRLPGAAGALCSSAGDLVRWTHLLHGGKVVSQESLRQMVAATVLASGQTAGYGYGLDLDWRNGRQAVLHGGTINGFSAGVVHYPADGVTVVVLTNSGDGRPAAVEKIVAQAAFGIEIRDLPLRAEDLARYEGTYSLQAGARTLDLRVFSENGQLKTELGKQRVTRLRYQGDHTFVTEADDDVRLVFDVDDGRAERVSLHSGPRTMPGARKR